MEGTYITVIIPYVILSHAATWDAQDSHFWMGGGGLTFQMIWHGMKEVDRLARIGRNCQTKATSSSLTCCWRCCSAVCWGSRLISSAVSEVTWIRMLLGLLFVGIFGLAADDCGHGSAHHLLGHRRGVDDSPDVALLTKRASVVTRVADGP